LAKTISPTLGIEPTTIGLKGYEFYVFFQKVGKKRPFRCAKDFSCLYLRKSYAIVKYLGNKIVLQTNENCMDSIVRNFNIA
jgi:hypothetical protein